MELIRKFYMADPEDTGGPKGPSDRDKKNAEDLEQIFDRMQNTLRSISVILKDSISEELENMDSSSQAVAKNLGKELQAELKKSVVQTRIIRSNEVDIAKGLVSSKSVRQEINKVQRQQAEVTSLIKQLSLEQNGLSNKQAELQKDILAELQEQLDMLKNQEAAAKKLEDRFKGLTGALKGLAAIPVLGQFIKADKVLDKVKEKIGEGASKMSVFAAGAGAFIDGIASGLTSLILPALIGIYKAVEQFNQKAFDIAKNLGVTVGEAKQIQQTFTQIASTSENAALTGKDLAATYTELSNTFGFLLPQNREFVETATLIQKRLGASAENMSALALQSTLSGKTLEETMGTLNASRNIEGARNKLLLSQKQILDGIAKTSAAVLINFKGDVGALGDAIVRATKLGTTLDTINKQGESLLDFESSISAEFEAQLLTGRDINLTLARDLALQGKTAQLGEELNRQGATYQQFMNENVIARQADAKAIGLSVEEYSKILLQQQQANKLGAQQGESAVKRYNQLVKDGATQEDIIRKLGSEQEAEDLRKASMQDKFQAAIEKLKDTLGAVLEGPVGKLVDQFAAFVGDQEKMNKLANTLKGIFDFIGRTMENFPQILTASLAIMKALVSLSIARAVASIAGSLGAVPIVGAAAGLIAGAKAYSWLNGLVSGGSAGAPGITTPTASPDEGMTKPINSAAAAASTQTAAANAQQKQPIVVDFHHVSELEGQPVTKEVRRQFEITPGYTNTIN